MALSAKNYADAPQSPSQSNLLNNQPRRRGDPFRSPRKTNAMNPYAPSETSDQRAEGALRLEGNSRDHCPICNASVNPWQIGNSVFTRRCPGCQAKIWMEYSRAQSTVAMVLPITIIVVWIATYGWAAMNYYAGLFGIIFSILNIYMRILIGHPVAKGNPQYFERGSRQIP